MKAVRVHHFGGTEELVYEDIDVPTPGPNQVLVRIAASGVGPWDAWIRAGKSVLPQPLPLTVGSDIAGVIETVGPRVHDFVPGQAVFGVTNQRFIGGYAEYAVAEVGMLAEAPTRLTFEEAASVPVIAVTAYQALFEHAHLKTGNRVLILGAQGNVGRYAVALAERAGIEVHTLVRGQNQEALFTTLRRSIDAVIDTVGGETQSLSLATLKKGGILISAVSAPDEKQLIDNQVEGNFMLVDVTSSRLQAIAEGLQGGSLTALVGRVLPLRDARLAHQLLEGSPTLSPGKIILKP